MLFYSEGAMQKFNLQTLIVFALGLIFGFCIKFSFLALLAILIALVALFIYTMRDAKELKHNQGKYFVVISAVLYFIALLFSPYAIMILVLFTGHEASNRRTWKVATLRLLPVFIITLLVLFLS
jgi:amino acid transporter